MREYTGDFALVGEGVTDHTVLKNILNPSAKAFATYDNASKGYRKRKELLEHGRKSPSLSIFLDALDARGIVLESDE